MTPKTTEAEKTAAPAIEVLEGTTTMATTAPAGALAQRPSFIDDKDDTGKEGISMADIQLPRLALAQGLSFQMTPSDSRYIPDLKMFDLFNDVTGEIYGKGPLKFIPVRRDVNIIEFDPDQRGVPLDTKVPPGDPRTEWGPRTEKNPKGTPPVATKYVDFVVILIHPDGRDPETVVLSIKTTNKFQTLAAKRLTTFITGQKGPIYSAYKEVHSAPEKFEKGTAAVFVIDNGKRLDAPGQDDEQWAKSMELFAHARKLHDMLKGKTLGFTRDAGDDDLEFPNDANPNAGPGSAPAM